MTVFVPLVVQKGDRQKVVTDVASLTQARYDGFSEVREASLAVIEVAAGPDVAEQVRAQRGEDKARPRPPRRTAPTDLE